LGYTRPRKRISKPAQVCGPSRQGRTSTGFSVFPRPRLFYWLGSRGMSGERDQPSPIAFKRAGATTAELRGPRDKWSGSAAGQYIDEPAQPTTAVQPGAGLLATQSAAVTGDRHGRATGLRLVMPRPVPDSSTGAGAGPASCPSCSPVWRRLWATSPRPGRQSRYGCHLCAAHCGSPAHRSAPRPKVRVSRTDYHHRQAVLT
jgi:hypothetical protein